MRKHIRTEPDQDIPASMCPHGCGQLNDCATDPFGDARPKPGDLSVCLVCGGLSVYDDSLHLRRATAEERELWFTDERLTLVERARRLTWAEQRPGDA